MARKKSGGEGGGNAILVVFLVLFILLSIGLGVAFWTGQQKVAEADTKKQEATKEINDAKDSKELADLKMKLYRVAIGTASEDDRAAVQNPPDKFKDALRDEHAALMNAASITITNAVGDVRKGPDGRPIELGGGGPFDVKMQDVLSWPWPTGQGQVLARQPNPGPLLDRLVKVAAERERMYHESVAVRKNASDEATVYKAEKDKYTADLASLNKRVQDTIKALDDKITAVETEKKAAIDTFVKSGDDTRKQLGVRAREIDDLKNLLTEAKDNLGNVTNQLNDMLRLKNEMDQEKRGVFPVNVPHGEIVLRETKGEGKIVEINIGSDAGLRPGQTFTVQPSSTRTEGLAKRKRTTLDAEGRMVVSDEIASKGSIEVVSVLGPRLSVARITDEPDSIRDSILKGDLLYNPLFRKNAKDHVVLVGIFDTNADGQDDITEVARNLAKRGAIVDGYFDLSTNKWESLDPNNRKPGPGSNTTYVVRGWDFDDQAADTALIAAKAKLRGQINDAVTAAKLKGAQEVKAPKFFAEIGYSFSPSISDESTSAAAIKYLKDAPAAPPVPK